MKYVSVAFDAAWCRVAFASTALLMAPVTIGSAWAQEQGQVFVSNYNGDTVTMYPLNATGNTAPALTVLDPPNARPYHIAINHRLAEVIVANNQAYSISIYNRSTGQPKRTIAGPSTGINRPTGVAIDEVHGEIYVANDWGQSITVYDELAAGDVPPKRTITYPLMLALEGLAVDPFNNEIVVAEYGNQSILTFDRLANGQTNPKRAIYGAGLFLPGGIALTDTEILVTNYSFQEANRGAILAFNRSDSGFLAAPLRKLEGSSTGLCNPTSVAIDFKNDKIVVVNANFANGTCAPSVTTYPRTWIGDADIAPVRKIAGASTTLNYPVSASIYYGATLSVSNKPSSTSVSPGGTVTFNLTISANGGKILGATFADTLPTNGLLTWNVGGTDAGACLPLAGGNQLICAFGDLEKGQSRTVQVSAKVSSCSGSISNQAAVQYNDGSAVLMGASPVSTVKCK